MISCKFSSRREVMRQILQSGPDLKDFVLKSKPSEAKIEPIAFSDPLTDSFGRQHSYLRVSLTERCNLRCTYCMPREGVSLSPSDNILTDAEILKLIKIFASLGIQKLRFTGGEPTVRSGLIDLIQKSSQISGIRSTHMTTNGIKLPTMLYSLVEAGLSSVNISLDSFRHDLFEEISRRPGKSLDNVFRSILLALRIQNPEITSLALDGKELAKDDSRMPIYRPNFKVKLNCVVMRNKNIGELTDFVKLARNYPLSVRFIELMPFDGNEWNENLFVSQKEMLTLISESGANLIVMDPVESNDTTSWYRDVSNSFYGRIGFISSMSKHFCGGCNRLRITADGKLKICLFGDESLNLRQEIRNGTNDDDLIKLIGNAVYGKKFSLGGHESAEAISKSSNRPMIKIGG